MKDKKFSIEALLRLWQSLAVPSLVPLMPGHKEGVEIKNDWPRRRNGGSIQPTFPKAL